MKNNSLSNSMYSVSLSLCLLVTNIKRYCDTFRYSLIGVVRVVWERLNRIPQLPSLQKLVLILFSLILIFQSPAQVFAQTAAPSPPLPEEQTKLPEGWEDEFNIKEPQGEGEINPLLDLDQSSTNSSAYFRPPIRLRNLEKKVYRSSEKVKVIVDNAPPASLDVSVFNPTGNEVFLKEQITSDSSGSTIEILPPETSFHPGRYRIVVKDEASDTASEQEFLWGVLAINTNKSIYLPFETADISLAVLNETGEMVCDANVKLKIINEISNLEEELSTENGLIKVNPECTLKQFTLIPDYEASYEVGEAGVYNMVLSATTSDWTHSIETSFEVRETVAFDVERTTATRIYPYEKYPVTFTITANQDFSGTVEEIVPGSFEIDRASESAVLGQDNFDASSTAEAVLAISDTEFTKIIEYSKEDPPQEQPPEITHPGLPFSGNFEITQFFGVEETDPLLLEKYNKYGVVGHDGVDFATPLGTEILAADEGKVVRARPNYDYGTTIVIEHSWGKTYYGHLSELLVSEGDSVTRGSVIGLSGSTGLSTGPHLHFGLKPRVNRADNGYFGKIDPLSYLAKSLIASDEKYADFLSVGTAQSNIEYKKIIWEVDIKKNETITLSYKYKAPTTSPYFYLLGPLKFVENENEIFKEARRWQIAADAVTPQGVLGFSETAADDNMQFLTYTSPSTFTDRGNSVDTTTNTNDLQHVRMEMAPTRDEMLSGQLETNGTLHITRCIGACDASTDWSEELEIAGVNETLTCDGTVGACEMAYDIAYEQLDARAVVFYTKLASDGVIFFNIWNGTSWVGEDSFTFNSGSAVNTEWVRVVAEGDDLGTRRSNRILIIVEDTAEDIFAMIYDNGTVGNLTTITTSSFNSDNIRDFDGAWESVTGNALVVWGEGIIAVNPYRYKLYNNGTDTWDGSASDVGNVHAAADAGRWINMDPHLQSNRIAATFANGSADLSWGIWKSDGSTAGWTFGTEDGTAGETVLMNTSDVRWERYNSGTPFAMYVRTDNGTEDVADYQTWTDGTGFSGVTDMPGERGDDGASWKLIASPNSDEIMAFGVEWSDDICSQLWSGSAWDTDCSTTEYSTTLPPDTAIEHNEGDAFDFSYRWYSAWSRNWRFYDGADSANTPTTSLANENTAPTGFDRTSGDFRLRFSVAELSNLAQTDARKKLQYTTDSPDSASATWTDVDDSGGSGIWRYRDCNGASSVCDDNTALGGTVLSGSPTAGWWTQDKDAAGGTAMDHSALQVRELEYSVEANGASASTTYYFRMYDLDIQTPVFREQDNDGSNDCATAACTYPSLTTASSGPTLDQLMRHGKWFSGGVEQPFTF